MQLFLHYDVGAGDLHRRMKALPALPGTRLTFTYLMQMATKLGIASEICTKEKEKKKREREEREKGDGERKGI